MSNFQNFIHNPQILINHEHVVCLWFEFAGAAFENQKNTQHGPFPWKRSVWQNPDQERTNQNAWIYLKTILPYNNSDTTQQNV